MKRTLVWFEHRSQPALESGRHTIFHRVQLLPQLAATETENSWIGRIANASQHSYMGMGIGDGRLKSSRWMEQMKDMCLPTALAGTRKRRTIKRYPVSFLLFKSHSLLWQIRLICMRLGRYIQQTYFIHCFVKCSC